MPRLRRTPPSKSGEARGTNVSPENQTSEAELDAWVKDIILSQARNQDERNLIQERLRKTDHREKIPDNLG